MAHPHELRRKVRASYVQGLPLTTAAAVNGAVYQTVRGWKRQAAQDGDDWDIARNARRLSSSSAEAFANEVLDGLSQEFVATLAAIKGDAELSSTARTQMLVQLGDAYSKALAASSRAMPNANRLMVAMEVIKFLTGYIAKAAPDIRERFIDLVEGAGNEIAREFGSGL